MSANVRISILEGKQFEGLKGVHLSRNRFDTWPLSVVNHLPAHIAQYEYVLCLASDPIAFVSRVPWPHIILSELIAVASYLCSAYRTLPALPTQHHVSPFTQSRYTCDLLDIPSFGATSP